MKRLVELPARRQSTSPWHGNHGHPTALYLSSPPTLSITTCLDTTSPLSTASTVSRELPMSLERRSRDTPAEPARAMVNARDPASGTSWMRWSSHWVKDCIRMYG